VFAAPSRLSSEIALVFVVVSAKLTGPLPVTKGFTSSDSQTPFAKAPDEATAVAPGAGAFAYVIVVSPHDELATLRTSKPIVAPLAAWIRSVAFVIVPERPWTSKRRYVRMIGESCTRTLFAVPKLLVARFWLTYASATVVNVVVVVAARAPARNAPTAVAAAASATTNRARA
jgi:hypothetical protein